jgi:endogenous inhibitor of DNA gyrase (YacG/DUF329 family)
LAEQPCPICGKPAQEKLRPFCSKRCADVDLGRWITGQYVVPGQAGNPEGETESGPALDIDEGLG